MKKYIIILLLSVAFVSCSNDDDNQSPEATVIGKWKLVEALVDPGDGSGTFQPVESNQTITFFETGSVVSENGSLCNIFSESAETSTGTFSFETNTLEIGCVDDVITLTFERTTLNLIIYYPCIEGCAFKYIRVD
ncbi:hypothetical protein [Aquimarina spongiae]|uniref:Lipocalin-like domain-containing protein n=1 Tax=Aquimarina spongiae TaxID=570521 RepID=A0A1M6AUF4_9FLAO|nr:hypothetical protein [Aquimarina spongiae]SHI39853.1 hypothetical protein SAMN04488508_101471 [Aquimarina spongiae]